MFVIVKCIVCPFCLGQRRVIGNDLEREMDVMGWDGKVFVGTEPGSLDLHGANGRCCCLNFSAYIHQDFNRMRF